MTDNFQMRHTDLKHGIVEELNARLAGSGRHDGAQEGLEEHAQSSPRERTSCHLVLLVA